jgi:diaminopimelate epimerase
MAERQTFVKMHGSGNDFVMFDARVTRPTEWSRASLSHLCDRRQGVGADGVIFISHDGDAVRMHYFNSDGSSAPVCGNGLLCTARWAVEHAVLKGPLVQVLAGSHTYWANVEDKSNSVALQVPDIPLPRRVENVAARQGELAVYFTDVGVPVAVVLVDNSAVIDLHGRGRELRFDTRLSPTGANVNFVSATPNAESGAFSMRTYERGIEGETFACGTGAIASAATLLLTGRSPLAPVRFSTQSGYELAVEGSISGKLFANLRLIGSAVSVYSGELAPQFGLDKEQPGSLAFDPCRGAMCDD